MSQRLHKIGIDANQPIDNEQGQLANRLKDPEIIASTGAAWVRINFVLGPYPEPGDERWIRTYRTIIDQYVTRGMQIYGLIGHESVKSSVGLPEFFRNPRDEAPDNRAERWVADYVNNFVEIVKLFQAQVKVFESFNEPDDWHEGNRAWIHPSWFAFMLDEIYRRVKREVGISGITLVSGPLQGLEVNRNEGPTNYLRQTYQYGKERLGWGREQRPYPFDGVGYHLYIHEGYNANWSAHERQVRETYRNYTEGMRRVIRQLEGRDKLLYISEIGWPSNRDNDEEKAFQAKNVNLALELLQQDPNVAVGVWFCTEDFAPHQKYYGLYQMNNPGPQGRKPAYQAFKQFCDKLRQETEERRQVTTDVDRPETTDTTGAAVTLTALNQQVIDLKKVVAQLQAGAGTPPAPPSGPTTLELAGEIAGMRRELTTLTLQLEAMHRQLQSMHEQIGQLRAGGAGLMTRRLAAPPIQNISNDLLRHPTVPFFPSRRLDEIRRIIVHHTGIVATVGAERVAEYRVKDQQWPGIGYHYFITGQGLIQQTNELTTHSRHTDTFDRESIAVCFAGNFQDSPPLAAQLEAGAALIAWLLQERGLKLEAVQGHKELANTESPGRQWDSGAQWGQQLRSLIQAKLG